MLIARALEAVTPTGDLILACHCRAATPGPADPRLCMKLMRRGLEEHHFARRHVTLDEDAYLILNGCEPGGSTYRGEDGAWPFVVFIGSDSVAQCLSTASPGDEGHGNARCRFGFLEHLRPHGDGVSQRLQLIARHVEAGLDDALWYEEQLVDLLHAALLCEGELQQASLRIASVKAATRQELLRRVLLATDFICSHYEQPITLDDIAAAASLSRFHLVRLFRQVHGVTPHAHLLAKRMTVAERLLAQTRLDINEIAVRAGFGTRWSLFRQLRKRRGAGGEALRQRLEREWTEVRHVPPASPTPCLTSA